MSLDAELLKILACPVCKKALSYDEPASRLRCAPCRRDYPVRDGIPILLVDDPK
ncbi:MAG: hypothetical protein FD126_3537 [Elusimicrobia bacterium]|nr:MAG: hypothetical protein FD126_3537 [Elusimicrobiota bacterium]